MNITKINEVRHQQPLDVYIEQEVTNYIDYIHSHNQNNANGLAQFDNYIGHIKNNLSRWDVAFDYGTQSEHYPNGEIYLNYYGWYVGYKFQQDENGKVYVSIFDIKPNLQELDLREHKQSRIDKIISETISHYLRDNLLIA